MYIHVCNSHMLHVNCKLSSHVSGSLASFKATQYKVCAEMLLHKIVFRGMYIFYMLYLCMLQRADRAA